MASKEDGSVLPAIDFREEIPWRIPPEALGKDIVERMALGVAPDSDTAISGLNELPGSYSTEFKNRVGPLIQDAIRNNYNKSKK